MATDAKYATAYMMQEVRDFNDQLERIAEVAVVLIVGAMLYYIDIDLTTVVFVALMLLVVRPVSVWLGLLGAPVSRDQRLLISWFGIRGIGSIYYLMFAVNRGVPDAIAQSARQVHARPGRNFDRPARHFRHAADESLRSPQSPGQPAAKGLVLLHARSTADGQWISTH